MSAEALFDIARKIGVVLADNPPIEIIKERIKHHAR